MPAALLRFSGVMIALLPGAAFSQTRSPVPAPPAEIVVAPDGSGNYKTVQAAFDAVPPGNTHPVRIRIKSGVYKEKLHLDADRPFVHLIGDSAEQCVLTFGDYAAMPGADGKPIGTSATPSVAIKGHDFTAENLTFENTAAPRKTVAQAVAVAVNADRVVFRKCRFLGNQDTLYANSGRQYYEECLIRGDVDFIFGNATAVFRKCRIESTGEGYVTAHSRIDPMQTTGYVFDECTLSGTAPEHSVYLGRPWRPYARVVYLHCRFGARIRPEGWNNWRDPEREKTAFYGEYDCIGEGAKTESRVGWAHRLTAEEARAYAPQTFLRGTDGWQPMRVTETPVSAAIRPSRRLSSRQAGQTTLTIPAPQIPDRVFLVTEHGAKGDGTTLNTSALQKTLDACAKAGGGTVRVPPGRYLTGPLTLASHINLHIEKGATLLLSDDPKQFTLRNNRYQDGIVAQNATDIAITGGGTIDGQGAFWWKNFVLPKNAPPGTPEPAHRPFLVVLSRCERVLVKEVTFQNSPMFHLVPQRCKDVRIEGIRIVAPESAKNTDGLDPSGWNFLITNCTFDVGDDCIALKPTGRIEEGQPACRDFLITKCTFLRGHGMSVGGQTPGGLENMTVRDCTFEGTDAGIRLKASRGAGGHVENIVAENLTMKNVKVPLVITSYYNGNSPAEGRQDPAQDPAKPVTPTTPVWRNIRFRNITATGAKTAAQFYGLAEMPIADVTLTNVHLSGRKGAEIIHARGVRFENSTVTAQTGAPVIVQDAEVTGIERSGQRAGEKTVNRVFNVRNYGAKGDGVSKDTDALEKALAACEASGGGRVVIPPGTYLTGPIHLRSRTDLHIETGAWVLFSRDHDDYPLVVTRYEGLEAVRCRSLLWGENLEEVAITGGGVFDGQGETWRPAKKTKTPPTIWASLTASGGWVDPATETWWPHRAAAEGQTAVPALQMNGKQHPPDDYRPYRDYLRPTMVELTNCRGILLDGPTFQNSPNWVIHLLLSDHIMVRNVTAFTHWWAQNGDGIDLDSCRHVVVRDSTFNAGDDGICLKSGKNEEGRRLNRPTEDVQIRNCTVYRGHGGVVIGSEMSGGVRKVLVQNCVFSGTDIGLRFKSTRGRGGVVEEVRVRGIEMEDILGAAVSFDMYYMVKDPRPEPLSERTPRFRDFQIRDISCQGAQNAILVRGLPEMPVERVVLEEIRMTAEQGVTLVNAKEITLRGVRVSARSRPALTTERVEGLKLERVEGLTEKSASRSAKEPR